MDKKRHSKLDILSQIVITKISQYFSFLNNFFLNLCSNFLNQRKPILISMWFSAILIFIGYFVNNSSLFTGEAASKMFLFEKLSQCLNKNNIDSAATDIVYFNVAYDKCLTPVYVNGDSVGQAQITDRQKINAFLNLLKQCNNYKFIILDVFFDSIDNNRFLNDSLPKTLASFDNKIIVADRDAATFAYPQLKHLTSKAKYNVTKISKSFSRYKYMYSDETTIPLHLYKSLNPSSEYKRIGLLDWMNISPFVQDIFSLYFLDGQLIQNSLFLHFDEHSIIKSQKVQAEDETILDIYDYYNIGEFVGDNMVNANLLLSDYVKDKIVVIGDLSGTSDSHGTYMDIKCGSEILVKAYHSINNNLLSISFLYLLFWFIIFTFVCLLIISNKPLIQRFKITDYISNKLICFLISLLSYSTLISTAMLCDYFIFERTYSLAIPIIFFSILKLYIQYKRYDQNCIK